MRMHRAAGQDEAQGHVTGRMVFSKLNEIVDAFNRLGIAIEDEVRLERITVDDIHQAFADYNEFANRPDSGMLMAQWYLGVPLSELPPVPTPEELQKMVEARIAKAAPSEPEASEPEEEEYPEGAVIFGGDYGDNDGDEGEEETPDERPADEVPEVQQSAGEASEPADEQDGEPVPAVP